MSYCRWSSDDHQCDVYVWEDCAGGWRTEVAGRRRVFSVDMPPTIIMPVGDDGSPERTMWAEAWVARSTAVSAIVDDESKWSWLDLPIPSDGRSYWHDTAGECADNLEALRAMGLNVPQYAIDNLRTEETS